MLRGGRPKDPVWDHFFLVEKDGKSFAKCKYCDKEQSVKAYRMRQHFQKCAVQPASSDSTLTPPKRKREDSEECENTTEERDGVAAAPAKRFCVQSDIQQHLFKTSGTTKDILDEKLVKFLYACNIPFSVVEHDSFLDFVQTLRPGYKPTTRKAISEKHLDRVTEQLQEKMKGALEGKEVTMVEDGWSNIHNEPVIARCLTVEGQSFYLGADETTTMCKTAENCGELSKEAIKKAETTYGCTVNSIVTDNAKNMETMHKILHENNNQLHVYGCLAHWLNLLGQDITPSAVMKHIIEVQKYFCNHHLPSAWLKECNGSVKPQLPGDTIWKSQLTSLDTFLTNRPHYTAIVQDHEDAFDRIVVNKIMDYNLYRQARDLVEQLKPVAVAIDKAQRDRTSLADGCDIFFDLLDEPALKCHEEHVQHRFKQAIQPCHLTAYMLHPKYQGQKLNVEQQEIVNEWLLAKNPDYLCAAVSFKTKSVPFPPSYFKITHLHPVTWWKGLRTAQLPENFSNTMVQLHSACASSASIERVFSSFSYIHSKLCNRLSVAKASKILFCYRMLRGAKELDY